MFQAFAKTSSKATSSIRIGSPTLDRDAAISTAKACIGFYDVIWVERVNENGDPQGEEAYRLDNARSAPEVKNVDLSSRSSAAP